MKAVSKDLAPLIKLALDNGCDMLCLNAEGSRIEGLRIYGWLDGI